MNTHLLSMDTYLVSKCEYLVSMDTYLLPMDTYLLSINVISMDRCSLSKEGSLTYGASTGRGYISHAFRKSS